MTTTTISPTSTASRARRAWALGAMELKLLARNKAALTVTVGLGPVMVLASARLFGGLEGPALSGALVVALAGFTLLMGPYYNLTTTAVARREELMLKRLTSGEVSRSEVLVGMALPSMLVAFAQVALAAVAVSIVVAAPAMPHPFLAVIAFVLGGVVMSALAYASSAGTRSVESAQLTTLPVMLGTSFFSGLFFPLDVLPASLQRVAELTPLTPVVTLVRLGLAGTGPDGATVTFAEASAQAGQPLLVLAVWCAVSVWVARRTMRWDARR